MDKDRTERGQPSASPSSTFNYTHTIIPTRSPISGPPEACYALEKTPVSANKAQLPSAEGSLAAQHPIMQQAQFARTTHYTLQPGLAPRSNPASPRTASSQKRYISAGSPQQPIHIATNMPFNINNIDPRERVQQGLSYGQDSPVTPSTVQGDEGNAKSRGLDDTSGGADAHSPADGGLNPASPLGRNIGSHEHTSPRTFPDRARSTVNFDSRTGPDMSSHHSGFTPVNSMRKEWHEPIQHQPTNSKIPKGRTGPLTSDQRELASQMRSISACANCKQLKQKVCKLHGTITCSFRTLIFYSAIPKYPAAIAVNTRHVRDTSQNPLVVVRHSPIFRRVIQPAFLVDPGHAQ
jgi:hypothetical protein